jgi:hypothetical protein
MSLESTAARFVELCNQGRNFDVMRTMYAPDVVSVEGDGSETAGQSPVIAKSERFVADNRIDAQKIRGPFFNGANQFAIHFVHDVTRQATGQRLTLEEVAVYTVKGDQIAREQFFFDGPR